MRFYEYEAKQLLAKQGVPTSPHPDPTGRATPLPLGEGPGMRHRKAPVGTDLQVCPGLRAAEHS